MRVERIESLDDPRVAAYRGVRDRNLARREGLFMVEGRYVLRILLGERSLYRARSVFVTPAALGALAPLLDPLPDATPVYLAEQGVMNGVVGFNIHRGCLAAAERADPASLEHVMRRFQPSAGRPLIVLEGLNNHDNIGGIFRAAAAFGAGAVLLDPACADPLYRKSIRVSMGGALVVPHVRLDDWPGALNALEKSGYVSLALTPSRDAPDIVDLGDTLRGKGVALLLGAEGTGLSQGAMRAATHRARIAMRTNLVDSLNVAAACAVALHTFTKGVPT